MLIAQLLDDFFTLWFLWQLSKVHIQSKLTQKYKYWIIWLNSFLTFKKFYLSAFRCVQSLICWVFGRFVKFKNIVAILKNNSAIYQKSSIKIIPIGIGTNNSVRSANISCLPRKPLFEVQFLMTCDSYL